MIKRVMGINIRVSRRRIDRNLYAYHFISYYFISFIVDNKNIYLHYPYIGIILDERNDSRILNFTFGL